MKKLFITLAGLFWFSGNIFSQQQTNSIYPGFPETFETGTKTGYRPAEITLGSGAWEFNDALLGNTSGDRKEGNKSVRIQHTGKISMKFNVPDGASEIKIKYGKFGSDSGSIWELWYSTDNGSNWLKTGNSFTSFSNSLSEAVFPMNVRGPVRFEIRKLNGGRLNIDKFSITSNFPKEATRDDNLAMGNPSNAFADEANTNNYLLIKPQYALSYNNSTGTPNWVSWHLNVSWKGGRKRCECFTSDNSLPPTFKKISKANYDKTGFDRGHLAPSEDRDSLDDDNRATFKMTNMMPQAPRLNQQTWKYLEEYCQHLVEEGNELYIIAGGYGKGGIGRFDTLTQTFASGKVTVPSHCWKVIVVLPLGSDDLNRVSTQTRVIAVDIPNRQNANEHPWYFYRKSVDEIEAVTGYDFLNAVPENIQMAIESVTDSAQIE